MKIRMVNSVGKEFVIDNLLPTDTIETVKHRLTPFIPKHKQLFYYELQKLEDNKTLADYSIVINSDAYESNIRYRADRVQAKGLTEDDVAAQSLGLSRVYFEASCMELEKLENLDYDVDSETPESIEHNNGNTLQVSPRNREIFLGSISAHLNIHQLKNMNITHILIVHESLKPLYTNHFKYMCLEAADSDKTNLIAHFQSCIEFIEDALQNKGSVLVHCTAGRSRSCAIMCAFIMYKKRISFESAIGYIQRRRPIACPNAGFVKQLQLFHKLQWKVSEETMSPDDSNFLSTFVTKARIHNN